MDIRNAQLPDLIVGILQHVAKGFVARMEFLAFHVRQNDPVFGTIEDYPEFLFRLFQRPLRPLALGDVLRHPADNGFRYSFRTQCILVFPEESFAVARLNQHPAPRGAVRSHLLQVLFEPMAHFRHEKIVKIHPQQFFQGITQDRNRPGIRGEDATLQIVRADKFLAVLHEVPVTILALPQLLLRPLAEFFGTVHVVADLQGHSCDQRARYHDQGRGGNTGHKRVSFEEDLMGINVHQVDRHHDTDRRRDKRPEKPGPGRRSREQPRRESVRSHREELPRSQQQVRERGRCRHRYRRGAIQKRSPVQIAQDEHRSGRRRKNPKTPGQVPEKLSALPSPLPKKEHRDNHSREEQERRRRRGHSAGGDRTDHWRIGKHPSLPGKGQAFPDIQRARSSRTPKGARIPGLRACPPDLLGPPSSKRGAAPRGTGKLSR